MHIDEITTAPIKLSTNPSCAIFSIGNLPLENTTTFGGVATGNINAQLALIVAGIIKYLGSTANATAVAARIGINRVSSQCCLSLL